MRRDLFAPALAQLNLGQWDLFGPLSFKRYLEQQGVPSHTDTAAAISIDFQESLPSSLRFASAMILRLGMAPDRRGTQFALVATPSRLDDFFIHEEDPPQATALEVYVPDGDLDQLTPYFIFPNLTETSMVNLAFASGLVGHALGLDHPHPTAAPATGSSTYTFEFWPHAAFPTVLSHYKGQVEVDGVFVGTRGGRKSLFVLEAKSGQATRTIAKHKLIYPMLALAENVPSEMPIVPVYMKINEGSDGLIYSFMECSFPDPRKGLTSLDQLVAVSHRKFALALPTP